MHIHLSSVAFHVLCAGLGFHVVIGVGRLIVRFHQAYVIPSFLLDVVVRLYLVIVNSDCSHNYCMLHIAKNGSFEVLSLQAHSVTQSTSLPLSISCIARLCKCKTAAKCDFKSMFPCVQCSVDKTHVLMLSPMPCFSRVPCHSGALCSDLHASDVRLAAGLHLSRCLQVSGSLVCDLCIP